eukprot:scaffold2858_cov659-Pavlova_lutheri.AAC.208
MVSASIFPLPSHLGAHERSTSFHHRRGRFSALEEERTRNECGCDAACSKAMRQAPAQTVL